MLVYGGVGGASCGRVGHTGKKPIDHSSLKKVFTNQHVGGAQGWAEENQGRNRSKREG